MEEGKKKLIVYELNEVPLRVLKKFVLNYPKSSFAYLLKKGILKKTFTMDEGELHPWSTWPTIHRGVNNKIHQIKFINQSLTYAEDWPPIWEDLIKNKISVGIFGSLQSYPPIKNDFVKFYLPDTFAPNCHAFPKKLEHFQDFNLKLTSKNKAISRPISLMDCITFSKLIITGRFNIASILKVIKHIIFEILNKKNKTLRPLLQPILGFDIYFKLLNKTKPEFSTFFTNHVAGIMHRYWKYYFPEDFEDFKDIKNHFHKDSINKSMEIADKQIGQLIKYCDNNNCELWVISSMGQEAIKREDDFPEIYVGEINKILEAVGLNIKNYELLPAMQPDLCIGCKDQISLSKLENNIVNITDKNGNKIFFPRYKNEGNTLNLSIKHSYIAYKTKTFFVRGRAFKDYELNIEFIKRDIGTGYHSNQGIYIGYGEKSNQLFSIYKSINIDTTDFFKKIKEFFKI